MSYGRAMDDRAVNPYLLDAMVAGRKKSVAMAYALWFFLGGFGIHNYYLGKPVLASLQLVACIPILFARATGSGAWATIALPFVLLVVISLLIDLFLIPARVRAHSERLRAQLEAEADWQAA